MSKICDNYTRSCSKSASHTYKDLSFCDDCSSDRFCAICKHENISLICKRCYNSHFNFYNCPECENSTISTYTLNINNNTYFRLCCDKCTPNGRLPERDYISYTNNFNAFRNHRRLNALQERIKEVEKINEDLLNIIRAFK